MTEEEKLKSTIAKATETPLRTYECIYKGFKFGIHWDVQHKEFVAVQSFTPSWPHTNWAYSHSDTELFSNILERVKDDMKLWTEGGGYPSDYLDNR